MSHEAGTKLAHTSPTAIESRSTPKSFDLWNLKASTANHRRQRALSNALHTISNQNIRIGSVYTRTTPDNHRTEQDALHTALLQQINTRLEDDGKFGILFTTTELPPPPKFGLHRILETATPPHTSAGTQMANIIAWAAHQHLTHHDQPNFCWDLYQDLRHIDIYGEPLAIDTETHWAEVEYASTTTESTR